MPPSSPPRILRVTELLELSLRPKEMLLLSRILFSAYPKREGRSVQATITALIAALAGVLGLLVGRFWDVRAENVRWRRDQRIRSYESLAGAYYSIREALRRLAAQEPGTPENETEISRTLEVAVEWNRQLLSVWLHGTEPVTRSLRRLDRSVDELFRESAGARIGWEEFRRRRANADESLDRFIEAVRNDLALPDLAVRARIDLKPPA